jgi:hypothetical protein
METQQKLLDLTDEIPEVVLGIQAPCLVSGPYSLL